MHEYELLEKRWKRYKRKKTLRIIIIATLFLSLVPLIYFSKPILTEQFLQHSDTKPVVKKVVHKKQTNIQQQKSDTKQETNISKKRVVAKISRKNIPKENVKKETLFLPNKNFEKDLKKIFEEESTKSENRVQKESAHIVKKNPVVKKLPQKSFDQKTENVIVIQKKDAKLASLISNFYNAPTYSKALIIAQKFYEQKKYENALKWSLKANELNKKSEKSWILFAKSMYKLGQKEKALQTLQFYLQKNPLSKKAKSLYFSMRKGLFNE
ncbi:tetratricopeptide repeat protein [Nitratiruptor sp. SB155-2]|uniref:tetratricopeptide repeat protein n=1 Tax=Nitratiruptor sp. (strain SB155-2) TaxID=387092 RepID=UPI00015872B4|nr:CDC27 family protein [Nitratiruptor sp. SB155-2]BAF70118.1 conserved hypothetical protein [Nitratiruptor sp. SB155-2]